MPELPEVETIVRHLRPRICGKKISRIESNTPRLFRTTENSLRVRRYSAGKTIKNVERFGKNIVMDLGEGKCMALHLMMTGVLLLNPKDKSPHERMRIIFDDGTVLAFDDVRKFGLCKISKPEEFGHDRDALHIGIRKFSGAVSKAKSNAKTFLLCQKYIHGIGNIYADEILWDADIHPAKRVHDLSVKEINKLFVSIGKILNLAIRHHGTSARDYRRPDGSKGTYYKIRNAYQKTGERCSRDGAKILRIVVGGRATHFCPKHQK